MTTEAFRKRIWRRTGGLSWEPPDPRHPLILELISEGYVKRVDGRWGYERFKDSHLAWTDKAITELANNEQVV
jgi:hypothetical protein